MHVQVCDRRFVPTYYAMDHYEGTMLVATDDGTRDMPKHVGDLLTSAMCKLVQSKVGFIN